jgi:5-hydroxyisourate hydrolase
MSVSAEIMDGAFGCAAEGIPVTLHREVELCWQPQASALTDATGRVSALRTAPTRGRYRLALELDKYFSALGVEPFQSQIEITFRIFRPDEDIHLLLTITPSSTFACRTAVGRAPSG